MSKVVVRKNLNRWFKEKWVDVSRRDKDGKHPPCGRSKAKTSSKGYPKCRPSVKVSSKTPKTSGQMTSGQKRAATKRKRSKKQGVGGKPTIVKQEDYPFVAMAEDEKQLPVPMHTNQPRSTHPGFSRTDVFQVPTGVGIPTAQAAPRTVPVMHAQGRTYEIADREQYERALRAPDEETRRAAMNEVPRVMTQGVQSGQNIFRMPTFYGMPYNEKTYFTTGEPMDLAFRLLKQLELSPPMMQGIEEQMPMQENIPTVDVTQDYDTDCECAERIRGMIIEDMVEFVSLDPSLTDAQLKVAQDTVKNMSCEEIIENFPNYYQEECGDTNQGFSEADQMKYAGEPMDLAFRLLKRDMSHCNCNAPKGFSCRAHCKSKEKR